jgi:hypothetical protein
MLYKSVPPGSASVQGRAVTPSGNSFDCWCVGDILGGGPTQFDTVQWRSARIGVHYILDSALQRTCGPTILVGHRVKQGLVCLNSHTAACAIGVVNRLLEITKYGLVSSTGELIFNSLMTTRASLGRHALLGNLQHVAQNFEGRGIEAWL